MFAELKQLKAICAVTHTHTHTLTDYSTLAMCPRAARLTSTTIITWTVYYNLIIFHMFNRIGPHIHLGLTILVMNTPWT